MTNFSAPQKFSRNDNFGVVSSASKYSIIWFVLCFLPCFQFMALKIILQQHLKRLTVGWVQIENSERYAEDPIEKEGVETLDGHLKERFFAQTVHQQEAPHTVSVDQSTTKSPQQLALRQQLFVYRSQITSHFRILKSPNLKLVVNDFLTFAEFLSYFIAATVYFQFYNYPTRNETENEWVKIQFNQLLGIQKNWITIGCNWIGWINVFQIMSKSYKIWLYIRWLDEILIKRFTVALNSHKILFRSVCKIS